MSDSPIEPAQPASQAPAMMALGAPPATSPATSQTASYPDIRQFPPSLDGILRWSLNFQESSSTTHEARKPMSLEDQAFLRGALSAMTEDVVKTLKETIAKIMSAETEDEDRIQAFDDLIDYIEDIDLAKDFLTIGGYTAVLRSLTCPNPELRFRAADVIAAISQNNPVCLAILKSKGILPTILSLMHVETDQTTLTKLVRALSSLLRGETVFMDEFLEMGGPAVLTSTLARSTQPACIIKTCFFIRNMTEHHKFVEAVLETGLFKAIKDVLTSHAETVEEAWSPAWEQATCMLDTLCLASSDWCATIMEEGSELKPLFERRSRLLSTLGADDKAAHEDELQALASLLASM